MPAKDKFHDIVKLALERESWMITDDPYRIMLGKKKGFIDLAAERLVGAEKDGQKIAVEIKSFLRPSNLDAFEEALGQFLIYKTALKRIEPDRLLYLALPVDAYKDLFDDSFFQGIRQQFDVSLIVYDEDEQTITQWIS
ncbi:XisH family protein [Fibrella aquatilis]|uniref:XisH family protein n=1 Tax=Fibrella aquatilis TaxID=2817059 RepID=A0A939G7G2_9BACT|nr:XisH family protein [Fibrella aquatilis]MBO0931431.1 XisH family protein [Fibrella aquatilis]